MSMLYWESQRRLVLLRQFRGLVIEYFDNALHKFMAGPIENADAKEARHSLNKSIPDVARSLDLVGLSHTIYYTPPPAIGGYAGRVDLLAMLFQLWQFQLQPALVVDLLDRAIGIYEPQTKRLYWQMFNPFFWLMWLLQKFLRIPFEIISVAGFNAEKLERSLVGKTTKVVMGLVVFLAALLRVLDYLGILPSLQRAIKLMPK